MIFILYDFYFPLKILPQYYTKLTLKIKHKFGKNFHFAFLLIPSIYPAVLQPVQTATLLLPVSISAVILSISSFISPLVIVFCLCQFYNPSSSAAFTGSITSRIPFLLRSLSNKCGFYCTPFDPSSLVCLIYVFAWISSNFISIHYYLALNISCRSSNSLYQGCFGTQKTFLVGNPIWQQGILPANPVLP